MGPECTILLVDDSDDDAFFFRCALKALQNGSKLIHVHDATAASLYLKREPPYGNGAEFPPPDMIVADSALGTESGVDLLEWVRVHPKFQKLPFVILSGGIMPMLEKRAADLKVTAVFSKPVAFTDLLGTIRQLLQIGPEACRRNLETKSPSPK
jgi:CheY-like chemotaxis protein